MEREQAESEKHLPEGRCNNKGGTGLFEAAAGSTLRIEGSGKAQAVALKSFRILRPGRTGLLLGGGKHVMVQILRKGFARDAAQGIGGKERHAPWAAFSRSLHDGNGSGQGSGKKLLPGTAGFKETAVPKQRMHTDAFVTCQNIHPQLQADDGAKQETARTVLES